MKRRGAGKYVEHRRGEDLNLQKEEKKGGHEEGGGKKRWDLQELPREKRLEGAPRGEKTIKEAN